MGKANSDIITSLNRTILIPLSLSVDRDEVDFEAWALPKRFLEYRMIPINLKTSILRDLGFNFVN